MDIFAYFGEEKRYQRVVDRYIKIKDFYSLANQRLIVPF